MKKEEILNSFKQLSKTQGMYGRILDQINNNPREGDAFIKYLEDQNINDIVDLAMFIEMEA